MSGIDHIVIQVNFRRNPLTNKTYVPILAVLGAIMLVVMAAMAPSQSFIGHDVVHAQTSDDATLTGLTIISVVSNNDLMPSGEDTRFNVTRKAYSIRAPSGTNKVTVNAVLPDNSGANVSISPSDQDSATDGSQVLLRSGQNTVIRVTVRSADGSVTETYTITVYQVRTDPSPVDTLSSLNLSGVRLSPSFTSANGTYKGRAAFDTGKTTVSYATLDAGATVRISDDNNGIPVTEARGDEDTAPGHQVNLPAGMNKVIHLVVTPESQVGVGSPETKLYTITIYRENFVKSDNAILAAASDNAEAGLRLATNAAGTTPIATVTGAAFAFTYASTMKSYPNVRVLNGVGEVTVIANPEHLGAVAVITPSDQKDDDGHQVRLVAGTKTTITVVVTAEDRTSRETYSITIYRERRTGAESSDATLSALNLSGVSLSPSFTSANGTYTGRAAFDTSKITVSYATSDVGAIVAKSATTPPGGTAVLADVDGNTSGYQINLGTAGTETVILVTVTAEGDGSDNGTEDDTKIYTITVYRENFVKSDIALLDADAQDATAGLRLTNAEGTAPIATGTPPTFSYGPLTKSYSNVRVANEVGEVTVIANPEHLGAVAVITPSDQDPDATGHQVFLTPGAKTDITVVVTAEDGIATETYSITIYRERRDRRRVFRRHIVGAESEWCVAVAVVHLCQWHLHGKSGIRH